MNVLLSHNLPYQDYPLIRILNDNLSYNNNFLTFQKIFKIH